MNELTERTLEDWILAIDTDPLAQRITLRPTRMAIPAENVAAYAETRGITFEAAREEIEARFHTLSGKYWLKEKGA